MKSFLYIILLMSFTSCKISSPTFKNLDNWQISRVSGSQLTVTNLAHFHNPNAIEGMKLNGINLTLEADGRKVGIVNFSNPGMTIPKLSDFQVPINVIIDYADLIGNVTSLISVVTGKEVQLRCIGDIKVGYASFNKSVKVDQTIPVNIKDIK